MANSPTAMHASDYIVPLNINGLQGRMLRMPAPKNKSREILVVYGNHSSIERCYGVLEDLNQYGAVTCPDLPGFGGMESFYKIGQKPTIDNLADYLASFVKLRYKRKKITIIGMSFGFVVVTRMLQRYPELAKKVELLVSIGGFTHKDDFAITKGRSLLSRYGARFFSLWLPSVFYWSRKNMRTHMATTAQIMSLDNCHKQVGLPVFHVMPPADAHFDEHTVEQHMKVVFSGFSQAPMPLKGKTKLLPQKLRRMLAQSS